MVAVCFEPFTAESLVTLSIIRRTPVSCHLSENACSMLAQCLQDQGPGKEHIEHIELLPQRFCEFQETNKSNTPFVATETKAPGAALRVAQVTQQLAFFPSTSVPFICPIIYKEGMSCTPLIPVLRLRQEDCESEANLGHVTSSRVDSETLSIKVSQTKSNAIQQSKKKKTPKT